MLHLTSKGRRLLFARLVLALTAAAFAIVVSVAASHVHVVPDEDNACSVCTAFDGKLHDGDPAQAAAHPFLLPHLVVATLPEPQRPGLAPTLTPPSCGPPVVA
jgi:hypothetical protein